MAFKSHNHNHIHLIYSSIRDFFRFSSIRCDAMRFDRFPCRFEARSQLVCNWAVRQARKKSCRQLIKYLSSDNSNKYCSNTMSDRSNTSLNVKYTKWNYKFRFLAISFWSLFSVLVTQMFVSLHTQTSPRVYVSICELTTSVCVVWPPARHMCLKVPQSVDDDDAVNDDDSYICEKDFQNIQSNLQLENPKQFNFFLVCFL